jgi:hypothetical protein
MHQYDYDVIKDRGRYNGCIKTLKISVDKIKQCNYFSNITNNRAYSLVFFGCKHVEYLLNQTRNVHGRGLIEKVTNSQICLQQNRKALCTAIKEIGRMRNLFVYRTINEADIPAFKKHYDATR